MTRQRIERVFVDAMNALRKSGIVPIDTGNLAYNAIKGYWKSDKTYTIYIDEGVAPYASLTIEKWDNRKNPNKGWFMKAYKFVANYVAIRLGGKVDRVK